MGQKTNPIGNRLGIIRGWDSNWWGGRDYGDKIAEDDKIRKYIFARLSRASVSNVIIERTLKLIVITITTARPGIIIGKAGSEVDKLKVDFETQISKLNEEINNFESQTNELNSTVSALDEEIKSIEVDTPQISIQIAKLNQDINVSTNIKANLAIATAKKMGLKVDEKAIQSIGSLDGKAIIVLNEGLVRVVDKKMLIDQAEKFSTPLSKFSINSKIYSADAIRPEILAKELITNTYAQAKKVREKATERLSELEATPGVSKAEIENAEAAREMAKYAEIAAGQSVVTNTKITSVATQQATLYTLKSIASTPGMNKWDVRRANAAVKAAEAALSGESYDQQGAVNKINNDERACDAARGS